MLGGLALAILMFIIAVWLAVIAFKLAWGVAKFIVCAVFTILTFPFRWLFNTIVNLL